MFPDFQAQLPQISIAKAENGFVVGVLRLRAGEELGMIEPGIDVKMFVAPSVDDAAKIVAEQLAAIEKEPAGSRALRQVIRR